MTIDTTDVVAPVLAAAEVIVLFFSCVTGQTGFRNFFRRFVLKGDDLLWITFFGVRLTWTMAGFATRHLIVPTTNLSELEV